jgi:glycogen(starch) synthase
VRQPSVTIVINSVDRAASLDRTLSSLRQLRYANFEVVVVQGPCADGTAEILARHGPTLRIGRCPYRNLAASRNIGIAMARGEIIAFLDDDAVPEPDWLDRLVEGLRDPTVGAVGGFIRDHHGIDFQHRVVIADRFGDAEYQDREHAPLGPDRYVSPTGTNMAFRREALMAIGGFDEQFAYFLDETDVNLRLADGGWRLALVHDAEIHHKFLANYLRTADRVPRSMYLIARSKAYFCWVNALGRHSAAQISDNLSRWRRKQRRRLRQMRLLRKIDGAAWERLIGDVEKGLEDGARAARSQRARPLLSEILARDLAREEFRPYRAAKQSRLRLCFLSRDFPPHGQDEIGRWTHEAAVTLAALGHEVTVLCLSHERHPHVDFVDGVWVHRLVAKPLSKSLREEFPFIPASLLGYSAAIAEEVARTRARRDYQVVIAPLVDLAPAVVLRRTGLRTVVTMHAARQTPRPALHRLLPGWRSGPRRAYEAAKMELLRSASLVLYDTPSAIENMAHFELEGIAAPHEPRESPTWPAPVPAPAADLGPKLSLAASFDVLESHVARVAAAY